MISTTDLQLEPMRPILRELAVMLVDELRNVLADEGSAKLDILTPAKVAKEIGRSPATVRGWCESGLLGKDVRQQGSKRPQWAITREQLNQFMQAGQRTEKPSRRTRQKRNPEVIEFFR
jgi:hypothetical protein